MELLIVDDGYEIKSGGWVMSCIPRVHRTWLGKYFGSWRDLGVRIWLLQCLNQRDNQGIIMRQYFTKVTKAKEKNDKPKWSSKNHETMLTIIDIWHMPFAKHNIEQIFNSYLKYLKGAQTKVILDKYSHFLLTRNNIGHLPNKCSTWKVLDKYLTIAC